MTDSESADEHTGPLWWIRSALSWALLLSMSAVLVVTIVIPVAAGADRFTVLTGSMQPTYPPGTLIIVKPVDSKDLRLGDAITYQLRPGEPAVVTHRIVASSQNARGERTYTTQGDANDTPDTEPVVAEQVNGKVWYSIPYLGYVNNWLTGQQRAWTIGALVIGLFSYALMLTVGSVRDARRSRRQEPGSEETSHHVAQL